MILLCYDRSASAKRAIAVAHETLADKPAMVLHVWTPPAAFLAADAFGLSSAANGPSIVEFERVALERAEAIAHEGSSSRADWISPCPGRNRDRLPGQAPTRRRPSTTVRLTPTEHETSESLPQT